MILLLDTSTAVCKMTLIDGNERFDDEWHADRELAEKLLGYLEQKLAERHATWRDLTGLAVMKGPGSFTGLRIGVAVLNTLADTLTIPLVGTTGDAWQETALNRLKNGENDQIVLPEYGRAANITTPRK